MTDNYGYYHNYQYVELIANDLAHCPYLVLRYQPQYPARFSPRIDVGKSPELLDSLCH